MRNNGLSALTAWSALVAIAPPAAAQQPLLVECVGAESRASCAAQHGLYTVSGCYGPDKDELVPDDAGHLRKCTDSERREAKVYGRENEKFWRGPAPSGDGLRARCHAGDEIACSVSEIRSPHFNEVVRKRLAFAATCPSLPKPRIGMTEEEVLAGTQWGRPMKINKSETVGHIHEQWVFAPGFLNCLRDTGNAHDYLYFVDGVLTGLQEEK